MPFRIQVGTPIPGVVWSPRSRAERDAARGPEPELTHRQKSVGGGLIFLFILATLVSTTFMAGGAWGWLAVAAAVLWVGAIRESKRRQGLGFFEDHPRHG